MLKKQIGPVKPDLKEVFEHQHSSGFWKDGIAEILPKYFVGGVYEDAEVK